MGPALKKRGAPPPTGARGARRGGARRGGARRRRGRGGGRRDRGGRARDGDLVISPDLTKSCDNMMKSDYNDIVMRVARDRRR